MAKARKSEEAKEEEAEAIQHTENTLPCYALRGLVQ